MSALAAFAALGAILAAILSFFVPSFAIFLALVVIVMAVVALIRARRGKPAKGPAITAIVLSVIALLIGGAMSPDSNEGFQQATQAASAPDPNALPAAVTVVGVQSPENLVTVDGRRLHVTMMQGRTTSDPCRNGTDLATARELLAGQQVSIAAPDAARTDAPTAVPAGFQSVVMTLPNGFDYAKTWQSRAANAWYASCVSTGPATATEEPAPTTTTEVTSEPDVDVDADVDRPYVPAPRTKARSGQSGHPCLPGERDGDGDGFCGE
ncbi:hypothetical protein GCM10023201_33920 [Actinomycetospora corticicola]|uniref:Cell division protein FtsN n=1 Tax=Actinomycetospora corticicola TaxID=663602 RepID=A0A7Y9DS98_9PSEU|nr:hypothetical protein [Actinomycetospora corticicola]NYD34485.1 cell division protein FtsN [Actinomycetospora corticicola]